jgi:ATPase family protein associated with various cellular activities (AAA)
MTEIVQDLELLVRSRYALVVLDTLEEDRAEALLRHVATQLSLPIMSWSRSKGLRRGIGMMDPVIDDSAEPVAALRTVEREGSGIYHFPAFGRYLDDPVVAAHVKDAVSVLAMRRGALVLSGHDGSLPDTLRSHAVVVRVPAPSLDEYRTLLERTVRDVGARMPLRIEISQQDRGRLIKNLAGLTLLEAGKIITRILLEDGALTERDIPRVIRAKRQVVEQDGLLDYYASTDGLAQVAGLAGLKAWLEKRRSIVADPERATEFGLSFPKGVLLLGVPGCGKSLCAKAVAREWGLPLLRLDPATLYNKYVGDSEKNFKRALRTAERLAPAVLWIDELEKAFAAAGSEDDGGVSKRIFGSFLSWLQDRAGDVFVVATANDVASLPPEFIRKGRFDEVFFVDLPEPHARRDIFAIHLAKRQQKVECFDLGKLADATAGFSGAEMEQAVVAGLYTAFAQSTALSTEILLGEIAATRPLSQTMHERLEGIRLWARERTVSAG